MVAGSGDRGVYLKSSTAGTTVKHCTIANSTNKGLYLYTTSTNVTVANSIIWSSTGVGISKYSSTPTVTYSDIQGTHAGTGNIAANPVFTTIENSDDFGLASTSPCRDTASNASATSADIDGLPRPFPLASGTADMGAHEYVEYVTLTVTDPIGGANPAEGVHTYIKGTTVNATAGSLRPDAGEGWRCALEGWTGTGSVPASGSATSTGAFVLDVSSSLTWLGSVECLLTLVAAEGGSVTLEPSPNEDLATGGGWYTMGDNVTLSAEPVEGYAFSAWYGQVTLGLGFTRQTTLRMLFPRTLRPQFVETATRADTVPPEPVTYTLILGTGWNLISLPVEPENGAVAAIFAQAPTVSLPVWTWTADPGQYTAATEMHAGTGYWIYSTGPCTVAILGWSVDTGSEPHVEAGWNFLAVASNCIVSAAPSLDQPVYRFVGMVGNQAQYEVVTQLCVGVGYWVHATGAGELHMTTTDTGDLATAATLAGYRDTDGDGVSDVAELALFASLGTDFRGADSFPMPPYSCDFDHLPVTPGMSPNAPPTAMAAESEFPSDLDATPDDSVPEWYARGTGTVTVDSGVTGTGMSLAVPAGACVLLPLSDLQASESWVDLRCRFPGVHTLSGDGTLAAWSEAPVGAGNLAFDLVTDTADPTKANLAVTRWDGTEDEWVWVKAPDVTVQAQQWLNLTLHYVGETGMAEVYLDGALLGFSPLADSTPVERATAVAYTAIPGGAPPGFAYDGTHLLAGNSVRIDNLSVSMGCPARIRAAGSTRPVVTARYAACEPTGPSLPFHILHKGWNLLSSAVDVPGLLSEVAVGTGLDPDSRAWYWDARVGRYMPATGLLSGQGYWVYVNSDTADFTVTGRLGEDRTRALPAGWSLVGVRDDLAAEDVNGQVFTYNQALTSPDYEMLAAGSSLSRGLGYWVKTTAETVLTLAQPDIDADGLPDDVERANTSVEQGGQSVAGLATDGDDDPDGDGVDSLTEYYYYRTSPWEENTGLSPDVPGNSVAADPDPDHDGIPDGAEYTGYSPAHPLIATLWGVTPPPWAVAEGALADFSGIRPEAAYLGFAAAAVPNPFGLLLYAHRPADNTASLLDSQTAELLELDPVTNVRGVIAFDVRDSAPDLCTSVCSVTMRFGRDDTGDEWASTELLVQPAASPVTVAVPLDPAHWYNPSLRDGGSAADTILAALQAADWLEVLVVRSGTTAMETCRVANLRVVGPADACSREADEWVQGANGTHDLVDYLAGLAEAALQPQGVADADGAVEATRGGDALPPGVSPVEHKVDIPGESVKATRYDAGNSQDSFYCQRSATFTVEWAKLGFTGRQWFWRFEPTVGNVPNGAVAYVGMTAVTQGKAYPDNVPEDGDNVPELGEDADRFHQIAMDGATYADWMPGAGCIGNDGLTFCVSLLGRPAIATNMPDEIAVAKVTFLCYEPPRPTPPTGLVIQAEPSNTYRTGFRVLPTGGTVADPDADGWWRDCREYDIPDCDQNYFVGQPLTAPLFDSAQAGSPVTVLATSVASYVGGTVLTSPPPDEQKVTAELPDADPSIDEGAVSFDKSVYGLGRQTFITVLGREGFGEQTSPEHNPFDADAHQGWTLTVTVTPPSTDDPAPQNGTTVYTLGTPHGYWDVATSRRVFRIPYTPAVQLQGTATTAGIAVTAVATSGSEETEEETDSATVVADRGINSVTITGETNPILTTQLVTAAVATRASEGVGYTLECTWTRREDGTQVVGGSGSLAGDQTWYAYLPAEANNKPGTWELKVDMMAAGFENAEPIDSRTTTFEVLQYTSLLAYLFSIRTPDSGLFVCDPVNVVTGEFVTSDEVTVPGPLPIRLSWHFCSRADSSNSSVGPLGYAWQLNPNPQLGIVSSGGVPDFLHAPGDTPETLVFRRRAPDDPTYDALPDDNPKIDHGRRTDGRAHTAAAKMTYAAATGTFACVLPSGLTRTYATTTETPARALLVREQDRFGNTLMYAYRGVGFSGDYDETSESVPDGALGHIASSSGARLGFAYVANTQPSRIDHMVESINGVDVGWTTFEYDDDCLVRVTRSRTENKHTWMNDAGLPADLYVTTAEAEVTADVRYEYTVTTSGRYLVKRVIGGDGGDTLAPPVIVDNSYDPAVDGRVLTQSRGADVESLVETTSLAYSAGMTTVTSFRAWDNTSSPVTRTYRYTTAGAPAAEYPEGSPLAELAEHDTTVNPPGSVYAVEDPDGSGTTYTLWSAWSEKLAEMAPDGSCTYYTYEPSGARRLVRVRTEGVLSCVDTDGNGVFGAVERVLTYRPAAADVTELASVDVLQSPQTTLSAGLEPARSTQYTYETVTISVGGIDEQHEQVTVASVDPMAGNAVLSARAVVRGLDGLPVSETLSAADPLTGLATAYTTEWGRGPGGEVWTVTDPIGATDWFYWPDLRPKSATNDATQETTAYCYDGKGRLVGVQDAREEVTAFGYNRRGDRVATYGPPAVGPRQVMYYAYDLDGNLVGAGPTLDEDGAVESPFADTYDTEGNRVAHDVHPVIGTNPYAHTAATFDSLGRLTGRQTFRVGQDPGLVQGESWAFADTTRAATYTDAHSQATATVNTATGLPLTVSWQHYGSPASPSSPPPPPEEATTQRFYDALGRLLQETDPEGNRTTQTWDALDRLTSVTEWAAGVYDQALSCRTFTYDVRGRLRSVTDGVGTAADGLRTTEYRYDSAGRLAEIVGPAVGAGSLRRHEEFEYWPGTGRVRDHWVWRDTVGDDRARTHHTYWAGGPLKSVTDPDGNTVWYEYDETGHTVRELRFLSPVDLDSLDTADVPPTGPEIEIHVTQHTYDNQGRRTATYTEAPAGAVIQDPPAGFAYTDRHYTVTQYAYYDDGRLLSTTAPDGVCWSVQYDAVGRVTSRSYTLPDTAATTVEYLALAYGTSSYGGDLVTRTDFPGTSTAVTTRYHYDSRGNLRLTEEGCNGTAVARSTTVDVQPNNLPSTTSITGSAPGDTALLTAPAVTRSYTGRRLTGRTVTAAPEYGFRYFYDAALGDLTYASHWTGSATATPDQVMAFDYDDAGRRSSETAVPLDISTTSRPTPNVARYEYGSGLGLEQLAVGGRPYLDTDRGLTAAGRTAFVGAALTGADWQFPYVVEARDAYGRPTAVHRSRGTWHTTYEWRATDTAGHLTEDWLYTDSAQWQSVFHATDTADYDAKGRLLEWTAEMPAAAAHEYEYSQPFGFLTNDGVATYTYDDYGNRLTRTEGAVVDTYSYAAGNPPTHDPLHRLQSVTRGQDTVAAYAYTDPRGHLASKTTAAGTTTYTWDGDGRLVQIGLPAVGTTPAREIAFTYDPLGRRIRRHMETVNTTPVQTEDVHTVWSLASAGADSLPGVAGSLPLADFDGAGNLLREYVWDAQAAGGIGGLVLLRAYVGNDPTNAERLYAEYRPICDYRGNVVALVDEYGYVAETYRYDGFGRTQVSGAVVLADVSFDATTRTITTTSGDFSCLSGCTQIVVDGATATANNATFTVTGVTRTTITLATDSTLVDELAATALRFVTIGASDGRLAHSAVGSTFLFSTKLFDSETGLYDFGARWYDPETGRFLSPDPLGFVDGPNPYALCTNDPVNAVDPWGLCRAYGEIRASLPRLSPFAVNDMLLGSLFDAGDGPFADALALGVAESYGWALFGSVRPDAAAGVLGGLSAEDWGAAGGYAAAGDWSNAAWSAGAGTLEAAGAVGLGLAAFEAEPALVDELRAAAQGAVQRVGPGQGAAYGTRVHSVFEAEVGALGRDLSTEVSYLNGQVVRRGTRGSVRLDVVEGPLGAPSAVFDLKTGGARLTPGRTRQIQAHIPGGSSVPIMEVRP